MSKSNTDSPQDGAMPDQDKAQEHITKAESFCLAAEFDEALKEIGKARKICSGLENINMVEAKIKATAEKYKAEISAVREALSRKEFSEASSACERASELCPQTEVTKSLEHKIKLEQAVQSGSERHEQTERDRRRKSALIKAIGIGALVVVVVAVLFVSVSYLKDISWKSKKVHQVTVPKTLVKTNSKKQNLVLEKEKQRVVKTVSLISQAKTFRSEGRLDKSLECVVKALSLSPDNIEAKQLQVELTSLIKRQEEESKEAEAFHKLMAEGANYEAEKDWENAVKTYKKALGIKPDSKKAQDSFINLCLAKAKANDNKKSAKVALKALEELLSVNPNHDEAKQLHKKVSFYNTLPDPKWWISKANAEVAAMDDSRNRTLIYTYCDIAKIQMNAGDITGSRETFKKIEDMVPATPVRKIGRENSRRRSRTGGTEWIYSKIAQTQAEMGNIVEAKASMAKMRRERYKNLTNQAIVKAQVKIGELAEAKNSAINVRDDYQKSIIYSEIAIVQAENGDLIGARKTIKEAKEIAAACPDDGKYLHHIEIAKAQAKVGDTAEALKTLQRAKAVTPSQISYRDSSEKQYREIVKVQAEIGDISGAKEIIASSIEHKTIAYAEVARVQAITGDITGAKDTLANISSDTRAMTGVHCEIARSLAKRGNIAEAEDIIAKLPNRTPLVTMVYFEIAKTLAKRGDLEKLLSWGDSLENNYNRVYAYLGVADGLIEQKDEKK